MKSAAGVAKPYARALFSLARERNQAEAIARDLDTVVETLAGAGALREFFARPWIGRAARRGAALDLAGRLGVSPLMGDFIGLVAERGRAGHLEAIAATYRTLLDEDQRRVRARVRTAVPLTDAARAALQERLARALAAEAGRRAGGDAAGPAPRVPVEVVLEEVVDGALLGGFVARIGSYVVDGSLDGQLARIRHRLATG